jgi:hypothetical protein
VGGVISGRPKYRKYNDMIFDTSRRPKDQTPTAGT